MALGLYTGQARQADVIRMGEQHISRECEILNWVRMKTENKTGFELAIPVHPELRRIIDATPSKHLTFLMTEFGAPFTAAGFGNWFRDRCMRRDSTTARSTACARRQRPDWSMPGVTWWRPPPSPAMPA